MIRPVRAWPARPAVIRGGQNERMQNDPNVQAVRDALEAAGCVPAPEMVSARLLRVTAGTAADVA
ncbi:MAG: hypothetical protein QOH97_4034 [Actinoplanes sp.]|jgi:hypothetical protein|nr:hypothetical protein [Actinoplanes sp.]